jgi:excisionase family DNA binding protein
MADIEDYLTTVQAAAELGVSRERVDQFCREERLKFRWVGNARMIHRDEVARFKKLSRPAHRPKGSAKRKKQ